MIDVICKLLYPNKIYFFSERELYTQKKNLLLSGCRGHAVLSTKRKLDAKYSIRVFEMKSLTCSLLRPLNQNRLCQDIDVSTQTFILDLNFYQIFHSYYNEN